MENKRGVILPLAAALAGLGGMPASEAAAPSASDPQRVAVAPLAARAAAADANRFVDVGGDVLAFLVTQAEDGTVVAQHRSHYSHSSHASHSSHVSSRW